MADPQPPPPEPGPATERDNVTASPRSLAGLDALNFFLADVQTGVGPFLATYLALRQWNEQWVGIALTVGGLATIAAQTPAGGLVDRVRHKRALVAAAVVVLAAASLVIAWCPRTVPLLGAQVVIGAVSSLFNPLLAAIALGLVGHRLLDRRLGRSQSFNSAGNVAAALLMGYLGYRLGARWIFYLIPLFVLPTLASLLLIRPREIDYERARGARDGVDHGRASLRTLLADRPLLIFLACAVLFHFANAAMLPLLGEMLSKGHAQASPLFMSACVVVTQLVITLIAYPAGKLAGPLGRKPLLLVGFAVLPVRGLLYTTTHNPTLLISIQILDGVGAGLFNVLALLVIADLTRGTGRFNVTQGAIFTAVGIGAALSQTVAGAVAHHLGYPAAFVFLSAIAAVAFVVLYLFMPETSPSRATTTAPRPSLPRLAGS